MKLTPLVPTRASIECLSQAAVYPPFCNKVSDARCDSLSIVTLVEDRLEEALASQSHSMLEVCRSTAKGNNEVLFKL